MKVQVWSPIVSVLAILVLCSAQSSAQAAGKVSALVPSASRQGQLLQQNDILFLGDVLKTDKDGRLRVRLEDGSLLSLGGNSQIKIAQHDATARQTSLELSFGRLRSQVSALTQPGSKFEIRTASVVAGVIGTELVVIVAGHMTRVYCLSGKVTVTSLFGLGNATLGPGEALSATPSEIGQVMPDSPPSDDEATESQTTETQPATNDPSTAGQSGSMVYSAGNATIDGSAINGASALLDRSVLDTGNAAATITRKGSTIMLRSNSRLALTQNNLRLGCGDASVKTVSGLSTLVQGYGVTPSGVNARYEVLQTPDHLQVSALEGDLWLFMGNRQVTVPAGQSISVPGECLDANALKNALPGETPSTPGYGPGVTGRVASGTFPKTLIIVTGVAAGTAATVSCLELCSNGSKPVSPTKP